MTIDEIRELKTYYVNTFYSTARTNQKTYQEFYDDTFPVTQIPSQFPRWRTGGGADIIDTPTDQISAGELHATYLPKETTGKAVESALKVTEMLNQKWLKTLMKQNPNPLKEYVKNLLLRGEAWIHPIHNPRWVTGNMEKTGMPVIFMIPDPMNIYASPNEDENGIPEHAIVFYQRLPWIIQANYSAWGNTNNKKIGEAVDWLEYWGKERYFEADEQSVLKGDLQPNIYGFVPFVHKFSGFGKTSPEGKVEDLIVSPLKKSLDLLRRECAITSSMDNLLHMYCMPSKDVQPTVSTVEVSSDFGEKYVEGYGMLRLLPYGIGITASTQLPPSPEMFAYLSSIKSELGRRVPMAMGGVAMGESGRLQDIISGAQLKNYEGVIRATENAFSTALSMGLRIISEIPSLFPDEIKKTDLNGYDVKVELKVSEPIEEDRNVTRGERLYGQGLIDIKTFLVEHYGKTEDEADAIVVKILVDKVTFQNEDVATMMGYTFAKEAGMEEEFEIIKQRRLQLEGQQKSLQEAPPPSGQQRIEGEVQTPIGREMVDTAMSGYGARRAPAPYTRGR